MSRIDMSVSIAGLKFENPLVLSEGPLSGNARLIHRAAQQPIGAIVTKSILPKKQTSPNPYMISARNGLINADWTDIGFDEWIKEIDSVDISMPLITNVTTHGCPPEKAAQLAAVLQKHGASMVTFSDYEAENLVEVVKQARNIICVPIMVKLPPFINNVSDLCKRLEAAGVDMIAAMDAVGPAMDIDINERRPILGCKGAYGYLSSAPIFPLTLAYIAEIASSVSVPVLGVGGVTSAEDVVKMIMAGATCVGMVGAPILKGLDIFAKVRDELEKWMIHNGVNSIDEIRGCAQKYLDQDELHGMQAKVHADLCKGCGLCTKSCYAGALSLANKIASVNYDYCTGCGVCQTLCKFKAIEIK